MAKKTAAAPIKLTEHRKNFVKLLNEFGAHGFHIFNVFNDFLHMAAISIANNSDPYHIMTDEKTFNEREETYKRILGKYKPALQELFPKMFAEIISEMGTYPPSKYRDVLGEIFHHLEFTDSWKGQFFTPQDVCNFMGITMSNKADLQKLIDEKGFITVNDPAVGGGALMLGAANGLHHHGFNPQKQMLTFCNDLDERCVWMCYIQLSLYGLPGVVERKNTLSLKVFDKPWFTPMFILGNWAIRARRAFEDKSAPAEVVKEQTPPIECKIPPPIEPPRFEQLSLF